MTTTQQADLRQLAEAARDTFPEVDDRTQYASPSAEWQRWFGHRATYLQAVEDPAVVLDLLARLEAAEARATAWESAWTALDQQVGRMPDAGFDDRDPRWDWWHETGQMRGLQRFALASGSRPEGEA